MLTNTVFQLFTFVADETHSMKQLILNRCSHGELFTQRPGWNKRFWGKIQCVLNKSPTVTYIQDERVGAHSNSNLTSIHMSCDLPILRWKAFLHFHTCYEMEDVEFCHVLYL